TVAPDYAFSLTAYYQPKDDIFVEIEGGSTSPLDASREMRAREAGNAKQWFQTPLARFTFQLAGPIAAVLVFPAGAGAETLASYTIVGDGIPASLTGAPGDAARGRTLVLDRANTCILCHSGPFPETRFQGDLAPSLAGVGGRWSENKLRLRLVDASYF